MYVLVLCAWIIFKLKGGIENVLSTAYPLYYLFTFSL